MSIMRNIFAGREPLGPLGFMRMREMRETAMDILDKYVRIAGITSPDLPVEDLSGGQAQAVAIARAVHFKRGILLLDEPTSALSIRETEKVLGIMRELAESGVSCVFVTHNLYHAFRVCDRFAIMAPWAERSEHCEVGNLSQRANRHHHEPLTRYLCAREYPGLTAQGRPSGNAASRRLRHRLADAAGGSVMTQRRDYSLNGPETKHAWENGLVSADWYKSQVPRERMKELMQRSNFPAAWHVLLWFALIGLFGVLAFLSWGTWWAVPAFIAYCTILTGSSDPRWHECGTARRSRPNGSTTSSTISRRSGCCANRRCGAGAMRATIPTRSSSAAIRRSSRRGRRTF